MFPNWILFLNKSLCVLSFVLAMDGQLKRIESYRYTLKLLEIDKKFIYDDKTLKFQLIEFLFFLF